jgi:hypothetical protein
MLPINSGELSIVNWMTQIQRHAHRKKIFTNSDEMFLVATSLVIESIPLSQLFGNQKYSIVTNFTVTEIGPVLVAHNLPWATLESF